MSKFTKLVKSISLLALVLLITNCAPNEAEKSSNVQLSAETKNWYDNHKQDYDAVILKYIKNLQWENAIVSNGKDGEVIEVPFTLDDNLKTSNGTATLRNDSHRLVFVKDGQQNFKTYYIQIFADDENFSSFGKSSVYYDVPNNFSGKVFKQDLKENTVSSLKYNEGAEVQFGATSKMREEYIDCTFFGYWKEDGSFTPIRLLYCDGGGGEEIGGGVTTGGGGGSGGTSGGSNTTIKDLPPSCESFNFIQDGSLWQVAMVKNINFKVIGISPAGIQVKHVVSYPQAIYFGAPTNIKVGNTDISPGLAANTSAKVLQKTMQEVIDKYGGTDVSDLVLDQYFRARLANNYPLSIPGGRVNFNSTSAIPATQYQTSAVFTDNCM